MLATASQAGAAKYYACIKKNGSARIYTKTLKCKPGESKVSWNNVGPAGRNGGLAGRTTWELTLEGAWPRRWRSSGAFASDTPQLLRSTDLK
jgi:hypothetical protein